MNLVVDKGAVALTVAAVTILWSANIQSAGAEPPRPLSNKTQPVEKNDPRNFMPTVDGIAIFPVEDIYLVHVQSAKSVEEAQDRFSDRAAAAILYAASLPLPASGATDEQNFGLRIVAKAAYHDYFIGPDQVPGRAVDLSHEVDTALVNRGFKSPSSTCRETAGRVGSSADTDKPISLHVHGEYDQLLTAYLKLYYKYYDWLSSAARECIFTELLSVRGKYDDSERNFVDVDVIQIPETENHRLMIQAAKYLTNQLYFQEPVAEGHPDHDNFDNDRNGQGNNPPLVNVIPDMLNAYMTRDFVEYNARNYQDFTMTALMNLADYAYDDRVRLAARMVLDYVSAKVAVSIENLRRSTPYRRRNEDQHYGPSDASGFLKSPLVYSDAAPALVSLGGQLGSPPSCLYAGGKLHCFAQLSSNQLGQITQTGSSWGSWQSLGGVIGTAIGHRSAKHADPQERSLLPRGRCRSTSLKQQPCRR